MKQKFSPKNILIEALKLIVMIVIVANVVSYIRKPELADKNLPDLNVTMLEGTHKSLQSYSGKPLVVYFWGSWCPVCKMSSPVISDLSKDHEVVAIAVNSGSDEDLKHFMKTHDLHFPVVNDADGAIARKFGVDTFPTTFIFNSKGTNTFTDVGYTTSPSLRFKIWISHYFD
ncbi:MAG: protein disulfide oxidoreductase [Sulfurospirillum sp.]|nr:MAG: protein disulfide oxidoreductase [Sulfurospirillum sp.]